MKAKAKRVKRPNPFARALQSPLFKQRRAKPLKGKGSYIRRPKHRGGGFDSGLDQALVASSTRFDVADPRRPSVLSPPANGEIR